MPFFDPSAIVAEIRLECAEATVVFRLSVGGDCSCALVAPTPSPLPQAPTPLVINRVLGLAGFPEPEPKQVAIPLGFNRTSRVIPALELWLRTGEASEYGSLFSLEPLGFIFYAASQQGALLLTDAREDPSRDRLVLHPTELGAAQFGEAVSLLAVSAPN